MSQNINVTEHLLNTSNMSHLEDVLDFIDTLHTVASDGDLPALADLDEAEMLNVLRDIIYTAQETLVELESARAKKLGAHRSPVLHIVSKVEKAG